MGRRPKKSQKKNTESAPVLSDDRYVPEYENLTDYRRPPGIVLDCDSIDWETEE